MSGYRAVSNQIAKRDHKKAVQEGKVKEGTEEGAVAGSGALKEGGQKQ